MPEGDTVRRTAAGLGRALVGRVLQRAELRWAELGEVRLAGRTVLESAAYGKHLLLRMDGGVEPDSDGGPAAGVPLTLHSHLKMDGSWRIHATGDRRWPSPDDEHVRAVLQNAEWTAVGQLLGVLELVPTADEHALIGHLGPDVLAAEWADNQAGGGRGEALRRYAEQGDRPVGAVLLDQRVAAGIGTFYMAETLFALRISPWTPAGDVDAGAVLDTARRLLLRGVRSPVPTTTGSTRRRNTSYVHARSGHPCRRCGDTVRVAGVGDPPVERPAFYCPTCQPGPTPTDDGRPAVPLGSAPHRFGSRRNVGLGPPRRWRHP